MCVCVGGGGGGGGAHELKNLALLGRGVKVLFRPLLGVTRSNVRFFWGKGVIRGIFVKCRWLRGGCRPTDPLTYTCVSINIYHFLSFGYYIEMLKNIDPPEHCTKLIKLEFNMHLLTKIISTEEIIAKSTIALFFLMVGSGGQKSKIGIVGGAPYPH